MAQTKRSFSVNLRTMNSNTTYRNTWTAFHNALIANGWVAGTDTGQANLATMTMPTTTTDFTNYRIYRLGDNGVGGLPSYYLRAEFCTGSTITTGPAIRWTIGNATDGAGNITGTFWQYRMGWNYAQSAADGLTSQWYMCSDNGSDMWVLSTGPTPEQDNFFFSFTRTKDPGTFLADSRGLVIICRGGGTGTGNTNNANQMEAFIGPNCETIYSAEKIYVPAPGGVGTTSGNITMGGRTAVYFLPIPEPYGMDRFSLAGCCYFINEMPAPLLNIELTVNGAARQHKLSGFMNMNANNGIFHYLGGNNNNWGIAFPWDGTDV